MLDGLPVLAGAPQDPGHVVVPVADLPRRGVALGVGHAGEGLAGLLHDLASLVEPGPGHGQGEVIH